jgi:hypothetical protein
LSKAISNKDLKSASALITEYPGLVTCNFFRSDIGHFTTAIHVSAECGALEIVELLVKKGASINSTDSNERTPFHRAIACGHEDVVNFLIKNKVDLESLKGKPVLIEAIECGKFKIAKLLIENKANVNTKYGRTILQTALLSKVAGIEEIIRFLVFSGADCACLNREAMSALCRDIPIPLDAYVYENANIAKQALLEREEKKKKEIPRKEVCESKKVEASTDEEGYEGIVLDIKEIPGASKIVTVQNSKSEETSDYLFPGNHPLKVGIGEAVIAKGQKIYLKI